MKMNEKQVGKSLALYLFFVVLILVAMNYSILHEDKAKAQQVTSYTNVVAWISISTNTSWVVLPATLTDEAYCWAVQLWQKEAYEKAGVPPRSMKFYNPEMEVRWDGKAMVVEKAKLTMAQAESLCSWLTNNSGYSFRDEDAKGEKWLRIIHGVPTILRVVKDEQSEWKFDTNTWWLGWTYPEYNIFTNELGQWIVRRQPKTNVVTWVESSTNMLVKDVELKPVGAAWDIGHDQFMVGRPNRTVTSSNSTSAPDYWNVYTNVIPSRKTSGSGKSPRHAEPIKE